MFASTAYAQWDSSLYPTWESQRKQTDVMTNMYGAIVERVDVIDGTAPDAPSFWRSNRARLIGWKEDIKSALDTGSYVDESYSASSLYNSYFSDNQGGVLPVLTVDRVCELAYLPTNYFDYTPYRCLNGLGAFTNDTTVGHAYGWTNSSTADGGSYFSGSRATRYTTDYGWQGLKDVIDEMVFTAGNPTWVHSTNWVRYGASGNTNTWANAISAANAEYLTNTAHAGHSSYGVASATIGATGGEGVFFGTALSQRGALTTTTQTTNFNCTIDFYIFTSNFVGGIVSTWNKQFAEGLIDSPGYSQWAIQLADTSGTVTSSVWGVTNNVLNWGSTPTTRGEIDGFQSPPDGDARQRCVFRWDIATGFKYQ